jgi:membrane protein DedA with SNARE-associated domain
VLGGGCHAGVYRSFIWPPVVCRQAGRQRGLGELRRDRGPTSGAAIAAHSAREADQAMFNWITSVIARWGYFGVAILTFLENVFPPIPSELVIPLAGFVAAQGDLRLGVVIAMGTFGSLAGATVWYAVGRRIGERRVRAWVDRHGRWLTLSAADVDRSQQWFERHGSAAVLLGRLMPGVRTFVSLPAGFSAMPPGRFLLYSALGTLMWTAALAYAGVALQANFTVVGHYLDTLTNVLLAVAGVLLARRYANCWRGSRRQS